MTQPTSDELRQALRAIENLSMSCIHGLDRSLVDCKQCEAAEHPSSNPLPYQRLPKQQSLTRDQQWIASLIVHLEDNYRAIDEGPIERARAYLMEQLAADETPAISCQPAETEGRAFAETTRESNGS